MITADISGKLAVYQTAVLIFAKKLVILMSYTVSFDASVKVKSGDVRGWLIHVERDVELKASYEHEHSNPDIDPDLTPDNITWVYDADADSYHVSQKRGEVQRAIDRRLRNVAKPFRRDAVVMRPLILQMDPDWYDGKTDEEKLKCEETMINWAIGTFGAKNLPVVSLHQDEGSRGLHLGFVPVTDDGRLSQKDWFKSPATLRKMHQDFRKYMKDAGYDVVQENKKDQKFVKRLSEKDYKAFQDEKKQVERLKSAYTRKLGRVENLSAQLDQREAGLKERELRCKKTEKQQNARDAAQEAQEDRLTAWAEELRIKEQNASAALKTSLDAIAVCERLKLTAEERERLDAAKKSVGRFVPGKFEDLIDKSGNSDYQYQ